MTKDIIVLLIDWAWAGYIFFPVVLVTFWNRIIEGLQKRNTPTGLFSNEYLERKKIQPIKWRKRLYQLNSPQVLFIIFNIIIPTTAILVLPMLILVIGQYDTNPMTTIWISNNGWWLLSIMVSAWMIVGISCILLAEFPFKLSRNRPIYWAVFVFCSLFSIVIFGFLKDIVIVEFWKKNIPIQIVCGDELSGRRYVGKEIEKALSELEFQKIVKKYSNTTHGTKQVIDSISMSSNGLGIIQGDISLPAPNAIPVRKVASIFQEPLHIFVKKDSINSISSLSNIKAYHYVNLSTEESGTRELAIRLLAFYGLTENYPFEGSHQVSYAKLNQKKRKTDDIQDYRNTIRTLGLDTCYVHFTPLEYKYEKLLNLAQSESSNSDSNSTLPDVIFMVSAIPREPSQLAMELLKSTQRQYTLLAPDHLDGFLLKNPMNSEFIIPVGVYSIDPLGDTIPNREIKTISATASIIANNSVPQAVTDEILRILYYDYQFQQMQPIELQPITTPENEILEQRIINKSSRIDELGIILAFISAFITIMIFAYGQQLNISNEAAKRAQTYIEQLGEIGRSRIESTKWATRRNSEKRLTNEALDELIEYHDNNTDILLAYHHVGIATEITLSAQEYDSRNFATTRENLDFKIFEEQLNELLYKDNYGNKIPIKKEPKGVYSKYFTDAIKAAEKFRTDKTSDASIKFVLAYAVCFFSKKIEAGEEESFPEGDVKENGDDELNFTMGQFWVMQSISSFFHENLWINKKNNLNFITSKPTRRVLGFEMELLLTYAIKWYNIVNNISTSDIENKPFLVHSAKICKSMFESYLKPKLNKQSSIAFSTFEYFERVKPDFYKTEGWKKIGKMVGYPKKKDSQKL